MAGSSARNNVLVGLFLVVSLGLAILVSFIIAGLSFESRTRYVVRFALNEGTSGLSVGSAVRIGGQQVGTVRRLAFVRDEQTGRPTAVDVTISINSDLTIFEDATAYLDLPLLGTLSSINLPDVGGAAGKEPLPPGGMLIGRLAPPAFLAQAGFGPAEQERVRKIIRGLDEGVTTLNEIVERIDPQVDPAIVDARAAIADLREAIARVNDRLPDWTGRVDTTLADVNRFTAGLAPGLDEARATVADAKDGIADARGVIDSTRAAIDDNRPKFDEIVESVRSATATIDEETVPRINDAVDQAAQRLEAFGEVADDLRIFLVRELPTVRKILANTRLASDQLKLAITEIRSQPWRLLIRPSRRELEQELLYDSARSYAHAVSDLRAASESLQAVLASASPGLNHDEIRALNDHLQKSFVRYDQAERDLLERMIDH